MRDYSDNHELHLVWPHSADDTDLIGASCAFGDFEFSAYSDKEIQNAWRQHLARVTPPEQPDGLPDDETVYPDPLNAAARVLDFVAAWGDGLMDVCGGRPLYARDLEVLAKTAQAPMGRAVEVQSKAAEIGGIETVAAPILEEQK